MLYAVPRLLPLAGRAVESACLPGSGATAAIDCEGGAGVVTPACGLGDSAVGSNFASPSCSVVGGNAVNVSDSAHAGGCRAGATAACSVDARPACEEGGDPSTTTCAGGTSADPI